MKWSLLSYNQKLKLLAAAAILLLYISFQYAIKKTWSVYKEYQENYSNAQQSDSYINLIPAVKQQEKKMADMIRNNTSDTINTPKETLAFITAFCKQNRLKLIEYQPAQLAENSSFNIATRQVSVEGSYSNLLKLLYQIENSQLYGRLCSASFKSVEDPQTQNITLTCTFYLQNLIQK